jgi:hypothetical protein
MPFVVNRLDLGAYTKCERLASLNKNRLFKPNFLPQRTPILVAIQIQVSNILPNNKKE